VADLDAIEAGESVAVPRWLIPAREFPVMHGIAWLADRHYEAVLVHPSDKIEPGHPRGLRRAACGAGHLWGDRIRRDPPPIPDTTHQVRLRRRPGTTVSIMPRRNHRPKPKPRSKLAEASAVQTLLDEISDGTTVVDNTPIPPAPRGRHK